MLNRLTDVFASFQRHRVKYLVIGGIAAVLYGVPRATFDLDALIEAELGTASLTSADELLASEITVFADWVRIDVQTRTPGLDFETAWEKRNEMEYRGQPFYIVSREDLISSKRAAGRDVDLQDVRLLELPEDE